jgi:glyoxylase-like metal-dependent hydrolase (beta-lactamase superfamily II)
MREVIMKFSNQNPHQAAIAKLNLKIGTYQIIPIATTLFGLDGGAMFGTVPKVLWEKLNPADDQNRIPMQARALLLDGGPGNPRILIDCGIGGDFIAKYGEKLGSKFAEIYAMDERDLPTISENKTAILPIEKHLRLIGLSCDDITHVILTHLHFDHCGGATTEQNGQLVPAFSKAQYYIQAANLKTARNPNLREKSSYFPANFEPLAKAGVLHSLNGAVENLLPGVSVQVSDGHTLGQQVVIITDGSKTLMYCADVIPTSSHIRLPWVMGYDLEPLLLIEEKRALLEKATREGWYLFFEHDPYMDAATAQPVKGDFAMKDAVIF